MSDGLRSVAALAMLSAGMGFGYEGQSIAERRDWSKVEHTHTPKPLSKRRKRRLRGKARRQP